MPKGKSISVGNWVRSLSPGIWQVIREVPEHYEPRYSLDAPQKLAEEPLLVLKRIVGDKWKNAFAVEVAGAATLRPLSKTDTAKLNKLLRDHDDLAAAFENYSQPLDLILNLSLALPKKSDFRGFKAEFEKAFAGPLKQDLTSDDIIRVIAESKYAGNFNDIPRSTTLQFACKDHEVKRKHFIFRQLQVHNF